MEKGPEKKVGIIQKFILAKDRMMWGGYISSVQQIVVVFQTLPKAVSCPCQITAPGRLCDLRFLRLQISGWNEDSCQHIKQNKLIKRQIL